MDTPSRIRKVLTIIVMVIATLIVTGRSLLEVPHAILAQYGLFAAEGFGYATAEIFISCLVGWGITYAIARMIQGESPVWGGAKFFPILLTTVVLANTALIGGGYLWNQSQDDPKLNAKIEASLAKMKDAEKDFRWHMEALGYPYFLHASALGAPGGLDRAVVKIKKARALFDAAKANSQASLKDMRQAIQASSMSPERKANLLKKIDGTNGSELDHIWQLSEKAIAENETVVADLVAAKGRWKTDGDKMVFVRQSDLDTYNRHIEVLNACSRELEALIAKRNAEKAAAAKTP